MQNRIWIYLSDKELSPDMQREISSEIENFLAGWNAHGQQLSASYQLLLNRFIIIKADEHQFAASGCSIDKQVHFIQQIEQKFGLNLFNRLLVALKKGDGVEVVHSSKIADMLAKKELNEESLVYDTSISTEKELNDNFLIPLKKSWLSKFINPAKV